MERSPRSIRTRGAAGNPRNRFERLDYAEDPEFAAFREAAGEQDPAPQTRFYEDPSRTLLAFNDSPDLGFDASLNPYRGCEHGCAYCYARPTHEYLGFSAGLDFETRILVKTRAPELLRRALGSRSWKPQVVGIGGVTDAYQPIERRLLLTRRCLEVFAEFRNPVALVTKSALVARDADLLGELARHRAAAVFVSVTTLDAQLARLMEPRAPAPRRRLETVRALAAAGVPVGVMMAPLVPGLTDHEIPKVVEAAAEAGAHTVRHIMLRLPHGVAELFAEWLERHFPERKDKVLGRIRDVRGGRLNDARFGSRMRGGGAFAAQAERMLALALRRAGLATDRPALSADGFRRPPEPQLSLF